MGPCARAFNQHVQLMGMRSLPLQAPMLHLHGPANSRPSSTTCPPAPRASTSPVATVAQPPRLRVQASRRQADGPAESSSGPDLVAAGGQKRWREKSWPQNVQRVRSFEGMAVQQQPWTYKYQHFPCSSPCHPSDTTSLQIEALFQNVLGYPRLPPRVHRLLVEEERDVGAITETVEKLTDRFGKELVLYFIRRAPQIILLDFELLMSRAEAARSMLDLRPMDMLMILRKNPYLMCLDTALVRSRYDALNRVTPLSRDSVRTLTRKFPLILNRKTELIGDVMESLRQISYTRVIWQENFDLMTPSLMAFFLRDFSDLLMRLEFLLVTGRSPNSTLKDVFKPSTNLFAHLHRGYRPWLADRRERLRQQQERAQAAAARSANLHQLRQAALAATNVGSSNRGARGKQLRGGPARGDEYEDEEDM